MEHPELFMDYLVNRLGFKQERAERLIARRMMAVLNQPYKKDFDQKPLPPRFLQADDDYFAFMYDEGFAAHLRALAKRQQVLDAQRMRKEKENAQRQM